MDYPGFDGFLGTRASLMLDLVSIAMFVALPLLGWSIFQVKSRKRYVLHKRLQLALASILGAAVLLFEIDMRVYGWRERAELSPFYTSDSGPSLVDVALWIHLLFSVSTFVLWLVVVIRALRNIPSPAGPSPHSSAHKRWGWIAAIDLGLTSITGWIFYYVAFVAS